MTEDQIKILRDIAATAYEGIASDLAEAWTSGLTDGELTAEDALEQTKWAMDREVKSDLPELYDRFSNFDPECKEHILAELKTYLPG
jgi:hypothetical protein